MIVVPAPPHTHTHTCTTHMPTCPPTHRASSSSSTTTTTTTTGATTTGATTTGATTTTTTVQIAKAWGCHVTVFSTSKAKEAEARALGAHAFVVRYDEHPWALSL